MTRAPGCTGKYKFASRELAAKVSAEYRTTKALYPYECDACGSWHLSKMTPQQAANARATAERIREHNADLVQRLLRERGIASRTKSTNAHGGSDPA